MEFMCAASAAIARAVGVLTVVYTRVVFLIVDAYRSTSFAKKRFAAFIKGMTDNSRSDTALFGLTAGVCSQIEAKATELGGDVLEIGAGAGSSLQFLHLPEKSSLVVVDYNPHMEKYFRDRLAETPHIKLKDYLVQSAADLSNIPDDSFAAVFVTDVLCSMEEEVLRKSLKEIKRVLKPEGCFYFLEHVLDEPGTLRRVLQKLVSSWIGIWPMVYDGCCCDKETWKYIEEAEFSSVQFNYTSIPYFKTNNPITYIQTNLFVVYFIKKFLKGFAQK